MPSVRARIALGRELEEASIDARSGAWERAADRVRKGRAYGGLELAPQLGLVPLGSDGPSGLEEFLVVGTGTEPARDDLGSLVATADTGIVLVLLPGGDAQVGIPPGSFPGAPELETPRYAVPLSPFFLAKHELSAGQLSRLERATGAPGAKHIGPLDGGLPAEQISWDDSMDLLARLGLELPTEAQWEYGARAGSLTSWFVGEDPDRLSGVANLYDASAVAADIKRDDVDVVPVSWSDGSPYLAHVGSLAPNKYGLHDTAGNVYEWCADPVMAYWEVEREVGTGLARAGSPETLNLGRAARGGSYLTGVFGVRSSHRVGQPSDRKGRGIGVRPARGIEPGS